MSRNVRIATCCLAAGLLLMTTTVTWGQRGGRGGDRGGGGRGGDRGGGDRGGGDRGGDRGGGDRGGGRGMGGGGGPPMMGGGFDPTAILQRMDRNGNGTLDGDEIDGRARFMIGRFAPDVDLSKPVKIETISKSLRDRMGGRDRGTTSSNEAPVIEPLVPGFGEEMDLIPIPGFGDLAALFDVEMTDEDEKEAEDSLRRYDRNGDGLLDRDELRRGRWYDEPTQYDLNADGSLSKMELTLRYAIRRATQEKSSSDGNKSRGGERGDDKDDGKKKDDADARKSYRFMTAHERLPEGTPTWFIEKDVDLDGQVTMNEFASQWNESTTAKFFAMDQNGDGILSVPESLTGDAAGTTNSRSDAAPAKPSGSVPGNSAPPSTASSGEIPNKVLNYAGDMVKKYDEDKNGYLSPAEAAKTRHKPSDWNGDGKITVEEYAKHLMKK